MGATGYMFMPEDDPTRLILLEPSLTQTKYIHLSLTTVHLTVEKVVPIDGFYYQSEDTSGILRISSLKGKRPKHFLLGKETVIKL